MAKAKFNPSDDCFTRDLIRRKIKQLIGRAGFTLHDREDIEQDLYVRVLQSWPRFNPDVAHRNAFITTVVERYVANILRNKQAAKRDHRRISSLNVMITVTDEGPTELAQTIGEREQDARLFRQCRSEVELIQLELDIEKLLAELPAELRNLAVDMKTKSIAEIARERGVPRTTLNEHVRKLLQRFEQAGLRDYLR